MMEYSAGFVTDSESIREFLGKDYEFAQGDNQHLYAILADPGLFIVKQRSGYLGTIRSSTHDAACNSLGHEFFKITGAVKIPFAYVLENCLSDARILRWLGD